MKTTTALALILICLMSCPAQAADDGAVKLPAGATLALPKNPGVIAEWPIMPGTLRKLDKAKLSFNVAPTGAVCLGAGDRAIFFPEIQLDLTTEVPIREFFWLSKGNMLVHSGQELGFLKLKSKPADEKADKAQKGMMMFSPLFKVPYEQWRMYPGTGDFFYVVGRNAKENRNEISAWNLADTKVPAKPLYATDGEISAVAGSPERTYFAIGPTVFALEKDAKAAAPVYVNPRGDIRELTYRPDVGLFFTTDDSAGYIGAKDQFEFLSYPGAQLRLAGKGLYIRFGSVANGILRITGPEHFAELHLEASK